MTTKHDTEALINVFPPHLQLESYTPTSSEDSGSCPARTYPVPIPVPSTSSCSSLASVISEHQPEVQDSRQVLQPTHTPMKTRSPARSQPRRSKRRAGCWTPQKDEGKSPVCKTTAEGHLQVSKSARFVRIYVRHVCRN